ncbi:hypothetical protein J5N97_012237 [Dioscorea zingiberensis]|uniref:DUF4378 domain-containing protein n=1 Tax=Dioscorea zingiberensis TaxID=325984 RepID=A0A9D5CR60_9LILI|nr:hypothetical protein J5N97_012237 [Dioscorea zingiberensis]
MAQKKHLRELLREEQEPFLLKSFIQERRGLLRRWPPSPKRQQQAHKIKSALIIPASPTKSPLLLPVLHHPKRPSSLLDIAAAKSPTSNLNPTACFILEAALRINQENKQKERQCHFRRSIRGLGLFGSVFKRLVSSSSRKPRREINQGRRDHVTLSVKDILVWDSPHAAGNCRKRIQVANCYEKRPSSAKRRSPSHGHDHGMENNDGDAAAAAAAARQPDDDIHQHQESSFSSSNDGRATSSSSSSSSSSSEENVSRSVRSDESRTPELASPPHRKTEQGQLVGGTGPEKEYDEEQRQEKEQQLSPVSVLELDPTLEEEEEEDHLEGHVEFYERSLAIVERSKRQLMHHLLRFQRLASLDPIELDLLLAQEEEEEEEHHHHVHHQYFHADADVDADDGNDSDSTMLHTHNQPEDQEEEEEEEIHLLIKKKDIQLGYWPFKACSCSLMPCPCEKAREDMKKLTLDLIDEEKNVKKHTTEQRDMKEEALLLEKVCKRFEAWKEVESNNSTIDMMVGLDLRPESQEWEGRCKDQVREIAALIEIAIFELLLCEFSDEQLRTINDNQLQIVS